MKRKLLLSSLLAVIIMLGAIVPTGVMAEESREHTFYGSVAIDGVTCYGSIVSVESVSEPNTIRKTKVQIPSNYSIGVRQMNGKPQNGDILKFYVDDIYVREAVWQADGYEELNLWISTTGGEPLPPSEKEMDIYSGFVLVPASFYGETNAGEGDTLQVKYQGEVIGQVFVESDGMYHIVVQPKNGITSGDTIDFYIEGQLVGQHIWRSGYLTEYDLLEPYNPAPSLPIGEESVDNPEVFVGLASILDKVVSVTGYKKGEGSNGYTVYFPSWVTGNTLDTLYRLRGYWIVVSDDCILTYGSNTYYLDKGDNFVGWAGLD